MKWVETYSSTKTSYCVKPAKVMSIFQAKHLTRISLPLSAHNFVPWFQNCCTSLQVKQTISPHSTASARTPADCCQRDVTGDVLSLSFHKPSLYNNTNVRAAFNSHNTKKKQKQTKTYLEHKTCFFSLSSKLSEPQGSR